MTNSTIPIPSEPCGPPLEASYPSAEAAFTAIQAHAKANGYAFVRRSSKPLRILFDCDRAGQYQDKGKNPDTEPSKQRTTGSKKCNCRMRVALSQKAGSNT